MHAHLHNTLNIKISILKSILFIRKKINNDNNIDFLSHLSLLKRHLLIEREICMAQNQEHKFIKFNPVLENL